MKPYPLEFQPVLKQTIWGGRRLGEQLGKPIGPESDYAESWEVVDHGKDQSVVDNGELAGKSLADVIAAHRGWLLGHDSPEGAFPLLLKYLDCNRVLSVQVHPCDAYGLQMEKPDLGKTEAWYIVASDPGSLIYAGLKSGVDRPTLQRAIAAGEAEQVLHSFHPSPGDVVFIPAGTVHALGAGLLVAEIQQSSDTTFRLFDWNRVDGNGNARPLHLQQALEVSDYTSGPVAPRRCDPSIAGWQSIVASDKFVLRIMERGKAALAGDDKFHIVTVPRGEATLRTDETVMSMRAGATVLIPAAMQRCEIVAGSDTTVMAMHLPEN
jgi:mannose-6-phosphate isomerase